MGRIQSGVGLVTGVQISDTVDKLMQLAARPRDMLVGRTSDLKSEEAAVTELSALLLATQYMTDNLGKQDLYQKRDVTSSDPLSLGAVVTGNPPQGTYQFTPLRMVQSQQMLSSGFASDTAAIGPGTFTFRFGGSVERNTPLQLFGGGQGVVRGDIRITDRSGASAEIDLSTALTIDDVLEAINSNRTVNVTAVAHGDGIRLIDNTGRSDSNLQVQEVGDGGTAASLGLAGIDVAAAQADGQDMVWLGENLDLEMLNDGRGLVVDQVLPDIEYKLRDGTTGTIDLSPIIPGSSTVRKEVTLGEVLNVINSASPGKLKAEIAPDGDRLKITDLTSGQETFQLSSLYDSQALEGLGLDGQPVDGVIVGRRILAGPRTVLLSSLNGGQGLGALGTLRLVDRSGAAATVDLSQAETLRDVLEAINAAGVGIQARVNQAGNGIEVVDTTGESVSHLIVASDDATGTAEKLGIAVDADVTSRNSGDLHLQVIGYHTKLADLNGGAGVARGTLTIVDTTGKRAVLDLNKESIQTVGDVIREINRLPLDVRAALNDTGDGILIQDTGYGQGKLAVTEGSATTARDLHLLNPATEVEINGTPTQVIDGSTTAVVTLGPTDSLKDLQQKINDLNAGVKAMIFSDGSSRPFRLSLASDRPGKAGQLVFDASQAGFSLQETVGAQDALLALGDASTPAAGVLVSSSSNQFRGVLPGVTLEIRRPSSRPVTISVTSSDTDLVATVKTMVDNYNKFYKRLKELTAYDAAQDKSSVLTGDATALRLDTELPYLLSSRFTGAGPIQTLGELGVSLNDDGTLTFDESQFNAKYAADPDAVERFFSEKDVGISAKFHKLIEALAGQDVSLLAQRVKSLEDKITRNTEKIDFWNKRLASQRDALLLKFYRMEIAIGKMQSSLSVLSSIKPLDYLTSTSNQSA